MYLCSRIINVLLGSKLGKYKKNEEDSFLIRIEKEFTHYYIILNENYHLPHLYPSIGTMLSASHRLSLLIIKIMVSMKEALQLPIMFVI